MHDYRAFARIDDLSTVFMINEFNWLTDDDRRSVNNLMLHLLWQLNLLLRLLQLQDRHLGACRDVQIHQILLRINRDITLGFNQRPVRGVVLQLRRTLQVNLAPQL